MNSIQFHAVILFMTLTVAFPICHASSVGGSDGGGGDTVICYSQEATKNEVEKNIRSHNTPDFTEEVDLKLNELGGRPMMLEVFEGHEVQPLPANQERLKLKFTGEQGILENIKQADPAFYQRYSKFISAEYQWQPRRYGVIEIDDATGVSRIPRNCILVQVAFYDDSTGTINYDPRIVDLMDKKNQLALKLHEDLYKMWRFNARNNSIELEKLGTVVMISATDTDRETYQFFNKIFGNVHTSNLIRPLSNLLSEEGPLNADAFTHFAKYALVEIEVTDPSMWNGSREVRNKYNSEVLASKAGDLNERRRGAWTIEMK